MDVWMCAACMNSVESMQLHVCAFCLLFPFSPFWQYSSTYSNYFKYDTLYSRHNAVCSAIAVV